jgi:hypothetical protein
MVNLKVLNPVAEIVRKEEISLAPRLSDLSGKTIGFYWNAKPSGDTINKATADLLGKKFKGMRFKNYFGSMGGVMRQASAEDVALMAKECDAVVGSLAD